jgi:alpha-galactosidase
MAFIEIGDAGPTEDLLVHEQGWQSWSPCSIHPAGSTSPRPPSPQRHLAGFRPDKELPDRGFQGEGLLAVAARDGGHVRIWHAPHPDREVASIRALDRGGRLIVSADGTVVESALDAPSLEGGLAAWAERAARAWELPPAVSIPPLWCSWYHYFRTVSADDVRENLHAAAALDVPVAIVQIDDGYEADIGDWLETSPSFGRPLSEVAAEILGCGRRAGIWVAPFLAGESSRLATEHPDWMVAGCDPGRNWGQDLMVVDPTHPEAAEWLATVFRRLRSWGFDYFKLDFLYAGALPGPRHQDASALDAYRAGLRTIRDAAGAGATLTGCGAPILPSAGLVDAMRVGPDIALHHEPMDGTDLTAPSQRGAALAVRGRAFLHGRFWTNDPDCLIARPEMERREEWALMVERFGGLRASGDRLSTLDGWGLETTRRLLAPSSSLPLV